MNAGADPEGVVESLLNLELGYQSHPGFRPELSAKLCELLGDGPRSAAERIGMSAAVDVKLTAPVFAGVLGGR